VKLATFAVVIAAFALASCDPPSPQLVLSGPTMGTTYTVKIVTPPADLTAHRVRTIIEEELQLIDRTMSGYRDDSEISRFNAAPSTEWFPVSPELVEVIDAALNVSARSEGAFDVTVAPLVQLWGFGPEGDEGFPVPNDKMLAHARELIGFANLHARARPPALRKDHQAIVVDLNGIAPGYAVDRLARRFEAADVTRYMIDIGGEIRVRGLNAEGERWKIAIERPIDADLQQPFAILPLHDGAVATSGDYRRYIERNGERYSHTIDPRSGRPTSHGLASVVVVASEAMYADAWATAYNVLGAEEGYELALRLGMPVMFISRKDASAVTRTAEEGTWNGMLEAKMTPAFETIIDAKR
jgi:thiamine biosynthesis lipoprotein